QLAERVRDDVGIGAHVGGKGQDRITGALTDAADAGCGIPVEDGPILGKGQDLRGILGGLPVGIVGAALDIVDLLAIELEGHAQLDQRLDLALPRQDSVCGRLEVLQMARADGGKRHSARPLHVDDAPPGQIALEGARGFFLDLGPGFIRYRGKLTVKVVHEAGSPLSEPMSSEPFRLGGAATAGSSGTAAASSSSATWSRKVADGTKKRLPVFATLKSSRRS